MWNTTHQRPLEAGGIVEPPTHDQKRLLLIELVGDGLNLVIQGQNFLYQLCKRKTNRITLIRIRRPTTNVKMSVFDAL